MSFCLPTVWCTRSNFHSIGTPDIDRIYRYTDCCTETTCAKCAQLVCFVAGGLGNMLELSSLFRPVPQRTTRRGPLRQSFLSIRSLGGEVGCFTARTYSSNMSLLASYEGPSSMQARGLGGAKRLLTHFLFLFFAPPMEILR